MKFLIVYTTYNQEEYIKDSLTPFLEHPDCLVVASSRKFSKFNESRLDNTVELLDSLWVLNESFIGFDVNNEPVEREHEARNSALDIFAKSATEEQKKDVGYVWIVDSDEFYTKEDIDNIIEYVTKKEPNEVWFKLCLKNFVFDKKTYLEDPFCPPRIFKTSFFIDWRRPPGHYYLFSFHWDNDIAYARMEDKYAESDGQMPLYDYKGFGDHTIPQEIAWVPHLCWLNDERSKRKVEYQEKHFGQCGYQWTEKKGLEFNYNWHTAQGFQIPTTKKL